MLPVLFVAMGNMLNGIYCLPGADDHMGHGIVDDDWNHDNPEDVQAQRGAFFANQLTLALTLVFMIPQLRSTSSLSNQASSNDTFVGLLFFGLCVGLWGGINRSHRVFLHVSNYILFGTLVVPVKHMTHYMRIRKTIHKAFRHDESPLCFNGRPGKPKKKAGGGKAGGGDVDVSTLAHFYAFDAAKAIHANDAISKHPDSPWRRTTSKAGVLESVYCGIRSEDIKTDVFSWGQPPQLTIDSWHRQEGPRLHQPRRPDGRRRRRGPQEPLHAHARRGQNRRRGRRLPGHREYGLRLEDGPRQHVDDGRADGEVGGGARFNSASCEIRLGRIDRRRPDKCPDFEVLERRRRPG